MLPKHELTPLDDLLIEKDASTGKIITQESFVRTFGPDGAIMLGFLFGKLRAARKNNEDIHGWFYCTVKHVQSRLGFTDDQQRRSLKKLKDLGVFDSVVKGSTPIRYFFLYPTKINILSGDYRITGTEDLFSRENKGVFNSGENLRIETEVFPRNHRGRGDLDLKPSPIKPPRVERGGLADARPSRADSTACVSGSKKLVVNSRTQDNFLPPPKNNKRKPVSDIHLEWATALREGCRTHGIPVKNKQALPSWANQFRLLAEEVAEPRIQKVLDWYVGQLHRAVKKEQYFPRAFKAEIFRDKFLSIETAMDRDSRENPRVELPPDIQALQTEILELKWPMGSEEHIPICLAIGYDTLRRLRKVFNDSIELPKRDKLRMFVEEHHMLFHTKTKLRNWMLELRTELVNWKEFKGFRKTVVDKAISFDSEKFNKEGRRMNQKYNHTTAQWDRLVELAKQVTV